MKNLGLAIPALLLIALPATGGAMGFAVGPYAGYNVTILQDDAGNGPLFGLRAKISALPALAVEPWFTMITEGDADHEEAGIEFTQEGGSIQSFGVNASLGGYRTMPGLGFYATGGIGMYMLKPEQDYKDETTRFGLNLGTGFVVKVLPQLDLDASARLIAITLEGGGSRKSLGIHAGLNYYFGM
jgi:opacity protein-like surface antigen